MCRKWPIEMSIPEKEIFGLANARADQVIVYARGPLNRTLQIRQQMVPGPLPVSLTDTHVQAAFGAILQPNAVQKAAARTRGHIV